MLRVEPPPKHFTYRHEAMATEFSLTLGGADESYLRQASVECFAVIDEVESKLSLYQENSDVTRINRAPVDSEVTVSSDCVDCLAIAAEASRLTGERFNIFVGREALQAKGQSPAFLDRESGSEEASSPHGSASASIAIDPVNRVVRKVARSGWIDLGAIGKGYALDRLIDSLDEWEIPSALANAGGSTLLFRTEPPRDIWKASLGEVELPAIANGSLASSGLGFQQSHIIDPKIGRSGSAWLRSFAFAPTAAWSDALSTALMLMAWEEILELAEQRDEFSFAVQSTDGFLRCGPYFHPPARSR